MKSPGRWWVFEVYGEVYQQLGFAALWGRSAQHAHARALLKHITMARIAQPESKRASVAAFTRDFGVRLPLNSVYRMLDKIDDATIKKLQDCAYRAAKTIFGDALDVLFYDCTTLYFESFISDELRQKGFSKDRKINETQVLLALLVTREGLPIGYEVFPGATFEGHTLAPVIKALKERYDIARVVFVADRGLFNAANVAVVEQAGIEYVIGAKLKTLAQPLKEKILDLENYSALGDDLRVLVLPQDKGRRLIVSHSPQRAKKDHAEREKAIAVLTKKLKKSATAKHFVPPSGYKKYLTVGPSEVTINEDAIIENARWDGLHGVITNCTQESVSDILAHYRGLWRIEESFRIQKHDLKVRPIYHFKESRIRAHLAIAFMSFCCVRHL